MNRSKRITLLLCVLVLISTATFFMMHYEQRTENIKAMEQVILELPPEDVQTLSWSYGEETLSFRRDEDGLWCWEEDDAFPVDEEAMNNLLSWFSSLQTTFVIEDVEDYSQYGLSDPACTISLTTEGNSCTVSLGDFSQMDSQRYLSIGDGNAYLMAEDPMEDFQITIQDMIRQDTVPTLTDVTEAAFSGLESYTIRREEDSTKSYSSDDVYFTGNDPLDTKRVESFLGSLEKLDLTNYVTYNATQEELTAFGMDDPELTVSVTYQPEEENASEEVFTLHISRNPEAVRKAAESEEDAEEIEIPCYLRVGDSPIVYEISESQYDSLTKVSYNDLRHQSLFYGDFEDVTEVDVTLDGASYTLTTTPPEDSEAEEKDTKGDEIHWYYNGQEIQMDDFRSALINLTAESFTSEKPTGKEEISLTLHLNSEAFPTVTIRLTRYDGSNCLAAVDGTPTALVKRVYMVDLMEAVNAIVLN